MSNVKAVPWRVVAGLASGRLGMGFFFARFHFSFSTMLPLLRPRRDERREQAARCGADNLALHGPKLRRRRVNVLNTGQWTGCLDSLFLEIGRGRAEGSVMKTRRP